MKNKFIKSINAIMTITLPLLALPSHSADKKSLKELSSQANQLREAPSFDLVGISFGQPIAMKKCSLERGHYVEKPCWEHHILGSFSENPLPQNGKVSIIPSMDYPGVKSITVQIVNDSVEGVMLLTWGVNWQDRIFESLSQKYGLPSTHQIMAAQNMMGANFSKIVAVWKFTNLNVSFLGISNDVYSGFVSAKTPIADSYDEIQRKEREKSEPKL